MSVKSYDALHEAIKEIANDPNRSFVERTFHVSATVKGKPVFDDRAKCYLSTNHHEGVISIYWEEAGLPDYKATGLFGQMSTNYQEVTVPVRGILRVASRQAGYEININFKS